MLKRVYDRDPIVLQAVPGIIAIREYKYRQISVVVVVQQ